MARESQRRQAWFADGNPQFLLQFTNQSVLRAFAGLDLAAGKLPQARHRFAGRALREENAPIDIDEGAGRNEDKLDAHGRSEGQMTPVKALE